MENAGIFYGHLLYFTVIWNISWPFGNVVLTWYIFRHFGTLCQEKSGNPGMFEISFAQKNLMPNEKSHLWLSGILLGNPEISNFPITRALPRQEY
jgi:hypothetical protein